MASDMHNTAPQMLGRTLKAPEGQLPADLLEQAHKAGRSFMCRALAMGAGAVGAGVASAATAPPVDGDPATLTLPEHGKSLGQPVAMEGGYGKPSAWEKSIRRRESPGLTRVPQSSVSFCPLQSLFGIITPCGMHVECHHQGWWDVDPSQHRLMINGLVKTPRLFTMDDPMRLPSVSHIHFIECGASSAMEWSQPAVPSVQYTHGMVSRSEFTGVRLPTLLELCGSDTRAGRYVLAEGAEGSSMTRTIAMGNALDGGMIAWGMSGEMLRPENGYPLRLVAPGVQGVSWVKYLRRIEIGDQPWFTKDEEMYYIDLMPDGRHRQFTSVQECKSVITTPSVAQTLLDKGFYNVTGLAWSGRGAIKRVDVSADGGRNWRTARLEGPVLNKALTRFNIDWCSDGSPAVLQSRAMDSTGCVQPKINQLHAVRGTKSIHHNNAVQSWRLAETGEVSNVQIF